MENYDESVDKDLVNLNSQAKRDAALATLKGTVADLDDNSLQTFVQKICRNSELDGYGIELLQEVVDVHKKHITKHVDMIVGSMIRALQARDLKTGGNARPLENACGKLVAAIVREIFDILEINEIYEKVCSPFLDLLVGECEPAAAGAAACITSVVWSDKWPYAKEEHVEEVCKYVLMDFNQELPKTELDLHLGRVLTVMNLKELDISFHKKFLAASRKMLEGADALDRMEAIKFVIAVLIALDWETDMPFKSNKILNNLKLFLPTFEQHETDRIPSIRQGIELAKKWQMPCLLQTKT